MPRKVVCFENTEITPQWPIRLIQNGKDNFTVSYGLQVDAGLSYASAAAKLGQALMHALACEGRLDNRMRGER